MQLDDSLHDLALIKIEGLDYETLDVASSSSVQVMDDVFVFGYPLENILDGGVSASHGQINAIRGGVLQIDAAVNPGNSGGPVLNDRGEVVGVIRSRINALYVLDHSGQLPERINEGTTSSRALQVRNHSLRIDDSRISLRCLERPHRTRRPVKYEVADPIAGVRAFSILR